MSVWKKRLVNLLFIVGLVFAIYTPMLGVSVSASTFDDQAIAILAEINEYRQENNLSPLKLNPTLTSTALAKSSDIIERDYWSHTAPDGFGFRQLINSSHYKYKLAGENLAFGYSSAEKVVDSWINSPSHNAVLLHPDFKEVGIGLTTGNFKGVDEITVVAAHFGAPQPAAESSADNHNLQTTITSAAKPLAFFAGF